MLHGTCQLQHVLHPSPVACIDFSLDHKPTSSLLHPLQELKKISAARGGEGSLLERFESTRSAVATTKTDRGIREKLASEASNAPKLKAANAPKPKAASTFAFSSGSKSGGSFNLFGSSSSSGPKPAAPKPLAPRPPPTPRPAVALAPRPAAAPAAPKAAAAAPKPAASAAAGAGAGFGGAVLGPVAQAVGVLGAVAVGANAVTSFATSNKKVSATSVIFQGWRFHGVLPGGQWVGVIALLAFVSVRLCIITELAHTRQ
jgi:hypothetical protein